MYKIQLMGIFNNFENGPNFSDTRLNEDSLPPELFVDLKIMQNKTVPGKKNIWGRVIPIGIIAAIIVLIAIKMIAK